jgi:hypothetical protein
VLYLFVANFFQVIRDCKESGNLCLVSMQVVPG